MTQANASLHPAPAPTAPHALRVLLVEDDPECAQLVMRGLDAYRDVRFEVTHAEDLSSGLQRSAGRSYDAIVLDLALGWSLPTTTMGSFAVRAPGAPILVFTAIDDDRMARFALGAGAFDYLVKGRQGARALGGAIRLAVERRRAGRA